jgi:hypothetical protein
MFLGILEDIFVYVPYSFLANEISTTNCMKTLICVQIYYEVHQFALQRVRNGVKCTAVHSRHLGWMGC